MTISTLSISTGPYTGTNSTDTYAYDFKIQLASEIVVVETDLNSVSITLVEGTNFSVTGVGNGSGGNVVRTAGNLPTGFTWLISRTTALTQTADFPGQGAFTPLSHENAFDKATATLQELDSKSIPLTAALRADKMFSFDSLGVAEANIDADAVRASVASALSAGVAMTVDAFTGDGTTTAYVLGVSPASVNGVLATIDGVVQAPTTDFTVSATTLTFTTAPPNNSDIVIRNLGNTVAVVVTGITTLANSATPSVLSGKVFLTGGTITITDFLNGSIGQEILILSEHNITITDGTNIFLSSSADFDMQNTDSLGLVQKADGNWYQTSESMN